MSESSSESRTTWTLWLKGLEFARDQFQLWHAAGLVKPAQGTAIGLDYAKAVKRWSEAIQKGEPPPSDTVWPADFAQATDEERQKHYWHFLSSEIDRHVDEGRLSLFHSHLLKEELQFGQSSARKTQSNRQVEQAAARRGLMEILLDPRSIQWLLALGGALMVLGLVILLWVNDYFTPPVLAWSLGTVNAGVLLGGWALLSRTRYQTAGKAITLLACLIMPLNLWYYHANGLITVDGHLWVAGLVLSAVYAASALVLKDEAFVPVFLGGLTLTGMLALADLPPSPQRFLEIALPSTLLVAMGLASIHAERAFAPGDGPFSRGRFGRAFFLGGHGLLMAGLLLLLGAQIAGDWLYQVWFKGIFDEYNALPSPVVGEHRPWALALVVAGVYAYLYSDLIVQRSKTFTILTAATLFWSLALVVQLFHVQLSRDIFIALFAISALVINGIRAGLVREVGGARSLPMVGLLLCSLSIVLGLSVYLELLRTDRESVLALDAPSWTYVGVMALTAISCRVGAYLYRHDEPQTSIAYFFGTAAATMVGAVALLAACGLQTWREHAPWMMLIPIAYVGAARLYRGHSPEKPLLWCAHLATGVMLISSIGSGLKGFTFASGDALNLSLAIFFGEAAAFYALAAGFYKHPATVHAAAASASAAVWQLLTYYSMPTEAYTLTFAAVGLVLLVGYRLGLVERLTPLMANALFQSGNTLLSLASMSAILLGLSRILTGKEQVDWSLPALCASVAVSCLAAIGLTRQAAWRRWYVVNLIGQAGVAFLAVQILSTLSPWQKVEIFSVLTGLLLLVIGHIGWFRESERQGDLVSLSLLLGSVLAGVPLAIATLIDRSQGHFLILNEMGFLGVSVVLLATGVIFRLRSTTLVGSGLSAAYLLALLLFFPWSRINTIALFILGGGGAIFTLGLFLSLYRERLKTLPERIQKREGVFKVLEWR